MAIIIICFTAWPKPKVDKQLLEIPVVANPAILGA